MMNWKGCGARKHLWHN